MATRIRVSLRIPGTSPTPELVKLVRKSGQRRLSGCEHGVVVLRIHQPRRQPLARRADGVQVGLPVAQVGNYAQILRDFPFEEQIGNSLVVKEPIGVVGAITPWNYPLNQIIAKVAAALAAGCTVVLKPSEVAPLNAFVLADAIDEAGVPAGVFNLVSGVGPVVGEALAAHPDVDMVSFTGSTRAGKRVAELAAAKQGIKLNRIFMKDTGLDIYGTGLAVKEEEVKKPPELVRAYVEATVEGLRYARDHQEEALKILLGRTQDLVRDLVTSRPLPAGRHVLDWENQPLRRPRDQPVAPAERLDRQQLTVHDRGHHDARRRGGGQQEPGKLLDAYRRLGRVGLRQRHATADRATS